LAPLEEGPGKKALIQGAGSLKAGDRLLAAEGLELRFASMDDKGRVLLEGRPQDGWASYLSRQGRMPLPPYIKRGEGEEALRELDRERYQTSYARSDGSVAAPTAGLHLGPELLEQINGKAQVATLTLHVGEATFRSLEGVPPGTEAFRVGAECRKKIAAADRVLAV